MYFMDSIKGSNELLTVSKREKLMLPANTLCLDWIQSSIGTYSKSLSRTRKRHSYAIKYFSELFEISWRFGFTEAKLTKYEVFLFGSL